jgi:hypothetical protein
MRFPHFLCAASYMRTALDLGPAAYGWDEGQRWTLARVTTLIGRLFHIRHTLRTMSYLLHRFAPRNSAYARYRDLGLHRDFCSYTMKRKAVQVDMEINAALNYCIVQQIMPVWSMLAPDLRDGRPRR